MSGLQPVNPALLRLIRILARAAVRRLISPSPGKPVDSAGDEKNKARGV